MWNFCISHFVQSELGQIYSLRDFDSDTGVVKQAKNDLRLSKLAISSIRSLLFITFKPISSNPVKTRSNILIESLGHQYQGITG